MDSEIIEKANMTVEGLGGILTTYKSEDIKEMINQFNQAEGASVVFDAMHFQKPGGFYGEQGGTKFWDNVKYKKQFLENLLPLIEFIEKTKREMLMIK